MFLLLLFLGLVGVGTLLGLHNWRWGLAAAIVVGLLQDPVRKLLPGTPAYLTLVTLPIWLGLAANVLATQPAVLTRFLGGFPILGQRLSWFGVYLVIPALISLTYGVGTWQITLLGAFVYGAAFVLLLTGWAGWRKVEEIERFLGFYAVTAGLMLGGGLLEYFGWGARSALIGADVLGGGWVTYRTGEAVYMLSGFFRGPDVLGWHAITVFMFAFVLAMRVAGRWRAFWCCVALWALVALWVCGRRKMVSMAPVFVGGYLLLIFKLRGARRLFTVLAFSLLLVGIGLHLAGRVYQDAPVARYYMTVLDEWDDQIMRHGFDAVIGTIQQAGVLGYGLGMSQQGVHNINAEKPKLWQESGPSKVVAELGVPGGILFLLFGYALVRTGYAIILQHAHRDTVLLYAGIFALFGANLASALVSAQIYGDPFIAMFLSFLAGVLLSGSRQRDPVAEEVSA